LDAPNYLIKTNIAYEGSLEAKYNYGKHVEGDVLIRIINKNPYFYSRSIAKPILLEEKIIITKSYKVYHQNLFIFNNFYLIIYIKHKSYRIKI
jgi:hypothetical protein